MKEGFPIPEMQIVQCAELTRISAYRKESSKTYIMSSDNQITLPSLVTEVLADNRKT